MDRARNQARALIIGSVLGLAIFSGCGQKGPLFLPEEETAEQVPEEADTAEDVAETIEQEEKDKQVLDAQ